MDTIIAMSDDISLKVRAEALGKSLDTLSIKIEEELRLAVKNLAHAAHGAMISKMQSWSMNDQNRADYMKALKFSALGEDSYLIHLDGDQANRLEDGFGSYSIRDELLKSKKTVGVGSRAGEPWVHTAKDGHKWAIVPFQHRPSGTGASGDLGQEIKKLMAKGVNGKVQPITKIWKDIDGNPIAGKVATVDKADVGDNANLAGLTKFQHISESGKVSSLYLTFRGVSEKGKDWVHPGFKGYKLFEEAERFVEEQMDQIILTVIK